jgi:hypothetical protein
MHIILYIMQNQSSLNVSKPSNGDTHTKSLTPTIFRGMSFNTANNSNISPVQTIKPKPITNVSTQRYNRSNKNFMFNGITGMNNKVITDTHTSSLTKMSIINQPDPSTLRVRKPAVSQPQNYSMRLERKPVNNQKIHTDARNKEQERIEAAKLRAKVKAEADVKARAAARSSARAAAKAAALERAQRAKDEASDARARVPTWERSSISNEPLDPSDTPYGV